MNPSLFHLGYLLATVLFIFSLKGLASPKTAVLGNRAGMLGMAIAIVLTLVHPDIARYDWIIGGLAVGALVGTLTALKIQMTAMPQLVAALHSFVGLAATLVAFGTHQIHLSDLTTNPVLAVEIALGAAIGAITFTGSIIAFGKLQELLPSNPLIFRGQHLLNLALIGGVVASTICYIQEPSLVYLLAATTLSLILGFMIVLPIGGADMPVVVSMLNSYSGWAASATGFTLHNHLLIATGALVGSSGAILSYIMCKAMNRSFISVILGGYGVESSASAMASGPQKAVKSAASEDVAFVLENASKVLIVPGYGMAVAQAQHSVKELYQELQKKGIEVKFAIHPVAGRMPGHMNVLLAESEIPYDIVFEMEDINPEFSTCDVALILGANDVVNPAARKDKTSPLYGMPILDAYKAKQVYVFKRSMKSGYAGVDNELFYYDNCALVFGDAKASVDGINRALAHG